MAYRSPLRIAWRVLGAAPALWVGLGLACGAQAGPPEERKPPRWEAWAGGETAQDTRSVYSGATWAPFGSVQEDGLRVRMALGQGYRRDGAAAFGDALVGYHKQLGSLTLKLFAGVTFTERQSPREMLSGIGAKGVLEAWWNVTDRVWASTDLSLAGLHMTPHSHLRMAPDAGAADRVDYAGRLRLGWRLDPRLSAGLEAGAGGFLIPAVEHASIRAGGFLRYEWSGGEVSISGGVDDAEPEGNRDDAAGSFATVSILTRF